MAEGRVTPSSHTYLSDRDPFKRLYSCPSLKSAMTMYQDFETSDRAELLSLKDSIDLDVIRFLNDASDVKARLKIFNKEPSTSGFLVF